MSEMGTLKGLSTLVKFVWYDPDDQDSCWEWTGSQDKLGYGRVYYNGKGDRAYRVFYEMIVGPIPEGLVIDHLCRNPPCVNPDHLEPVTTRENLSRGDPTRYNRIKTECPSGHPYDKENTYNRPDGRGRQCKICMRTHTANWRRRQSA